MKKILPVLLCGVLCLTALCGCRADKTETVNPISESTLEELAAELGCTLLLDKVELSAPQVLRYNTEPVLYQLSFLAADGCSYTLRLQKNAPEADISGMHYTWTQSAEYTDPACSILLNGEGQGICLWQAGDIRFSLAVQENAEERALRSLQKTLYAAARLPEPEQ